MCAPRPETLVVQNDRWAVHVTSSEIAAQAVLLACCTALRKLSTSDPLTQAAFVALESCTTLRELHPPAAVRLGPTAETTPPGSVLSPALRHVQPEFDGPAESDAYLLGACSDDVPAAFGTDVCVDDLRQHEVGGSAIA